MPNNTSGPSGMPHRLSVFRVFVLAVCFGLLTGLIEGLGLLAVFGHGWINSNIRVGVSAQIIWISAGFDFALFVALAGFIAVFGKWMPRLNQFRIVTGLFLFVTFVDWTALSGRLGPLAVLFLAAGLMVASSRWLTKYASVVERWSTRTALCLIAATIVCATTVVLLPRKTEQASTEGLTSLRSTAPNVLVVVVDTLRADHTSLYGYERPTTPNLERIASQGVVFDNDIAASSWTLPSHASMLTGRYPHDHGADGEHPLDRRFPTLAEVLRAQGYRTGGFSANLFYFSRRAGFSRGFLHFEDYFYSLGDMFYRTLWGRIVNKYLPDDPRWDEFPERKRASEVNNELLHWIDKDPHKAFFAFLNYFDLHEPYLPPQPYRSQFYNVPPAHQQVRPTFTSGDQQILRNDNPYLYRLARMSPAEFQHQVDAYDGAIVYVDQQIANLLAELHKRGLDKNTLLVITSDHGEAFGDHGLLTHRNALYRELIHVPLVYWCPGRIPAGIHVDRPVSNTSLPSTILDLLGDETPLFPSSSIATLWKHPDASADWIYPISELVQTLYIPKAYPAHAGWTKAIVSPEWELIVSGKLPPELYNWQADPGEVHNLATDTSQGARLSSLKSQLWSEVEEHSGSSSAVAVVETNKR